MIGQTVFQWLLDCIALESPGFVLKRGVTFWIIKSDDLIILSVHNYFLNVWQLLSLQLANNFIYVLVLSASLDIGFFDYSL